MEGTEHATPGNVLFFNSIPYQTHCDICPMSHQVASTSGKIELKTRYFLQNIAFLSQSRRSIDITNAPPVLN